MYSKHDIIISHLKPSPLLVATSSLLCLPALFMIIHKSYHDLMKYYKTIVSMFIMSSASICRWAIPTPLTCKLDRFLAKLSFGYFVFLHITLNSNIILSLIHCSFCVMLFIASRYFRKQRYNPIWKLFHMSFHLSIVYYFMNDIYSI